MRVWGRISEYLLKPLNKRVILVVVVTVIATELFIVTDIGPFRFSIGTVVFVYAILSLNHILIIPTAVMVAFSTLLLRVGLDYFFWLPREYFNFMVAHQYSGVVYFMLLALILKLGGIREGTRNISLTLVLYLGGAVILSNLAEALVRVSSVDIFTLVNLIILILMSSVQVFLVTSLVNISQFQKTLVMDEQQRVSYEKMLIIASELYDELFYMQKSMENIENIMAKSYNLHKRLKELKLADRSFEHSALEIAEEVHEVKKDTIRILAGLGEALKIRKEKPVMNLSEILDLVIKTNRSYSQSLDKKIQYSLRIEEDLEVEQIYPLLAILNNLVSNAVEAITSEGLIHLVIRCRNSILRIYVCDNGEPIKDRDRNLMFEPGYTTKFSAEGVPSTGIGLAYVKGLVENFRGRVVYRKIKEEKCFIVMIPAGSISGGQ
ncbi:MAG: sensor histidine kinase [Bacillota bacterium]|nr:sensor histidine kinase [Bacillota bacterium]MDW7728465.1 sensor histidine kinase [Bacillota bacterium]